MIKYKIRDSDWLTFPLIIVNFNHLFIQPAQSESRECDPGVSSSTLVGPTVVASVDRIGMLIDYPVYLGNNKELLTDMSNAGAFHPRFPTLKLAVWKISGDSSRQLAFQTQLSNFFQTALRPQPSNHTTAHGLSRVAGVITAK